VRAWLSSTPRASRVANGWEDLPTTPPLGLCIGQGVASPYFSSSHRVVGALPSAALLGIALASVVVAGCGTLSSGADRPQANRPRAERPMPGRARPSTTVTAADEVPPPTTAAAVPQPGPILEVGDSLGIDLGWGMSEALAGTSDKFIGAAVGDTGLAETWFYDWPTHLKSELASYRPIVIVVFLGANDAESLYVNDKFLPFGSPGWGQAYGTRVSKIMDEATSVGSRVLWVGMPPMSTPSFSSDMEEVNRVYQERAAAFRPKKDVSFLSTWTVLGGPQGQYEQSAPSSGGAEVELRAPDGVHITPAGAAIVAKAVVARLKRLGWAR
jgi:uncharacterized protein